VYYIRHQLSIFKYIYVYVCIYNNILQLENIGSRIDMQTHAAATASGSTAQEYAAQLPAMVTSNRTTVRFS